MPKIIENIRERLLEEAQRQVMEHGYSSMTIRSVAKACGVGVGTVYNYFCSKDMLVASFMLTDWEQCITDIYAGCGISTLQDENKQKPEEISFQEILTCICDVLAGFVTKYTGLFQDTSAGARFASDHLKRHRQLRSQIAKPILQVLSLQETERAVSKEFLAEFIAENLLTWILEERSQEEIVGILLPLL